MREQEAIISFEDFCRRRWREGRHEAHGSTSGHKWDEYKKKKKKSKWSLKFNSISFVRVARDCLKGREFSVGKEMVRNG